MSGSRPPAPNPAESNPPARNPATPNPAKSHPLLTDLVYNSLDPGYAEAAARRGNAPRKPWYEAAALAVGGLLAGFVLVVAYVHANRTAPQEQRVHQALVSRVQGAQSQASDLAGRVAGLERALGRARQRALPTSGALVQRLNRAELAAGELAAHGPGITVTLREPPAPTASPTTGRGGTVPIGQTNILTDRDIRSVVNELWHDGAEAVAVNGIRLTATSAIRFAGEAILVDFQSITSPYTISAIGNADQLITRFAQSDVASRYKTLAGVDGIGFTFATNADLTLPAGALGPVRYARANPGRGPR